MTLARRNDGKGSPDTPIIKVPTGIAGLDEITLGGLPKGRPTLVCGGAGSGKTQLGMAFLVNGARVYDEPGVFVAFEETPRELSQNFASLGYGIDELIRQKKLVVDYVYVERSEIEETGEYDLEGLFVRLGHSIDSIGAKRIVLDTIEVLFSGLSNHAILRAELRRLFRWLKEKGITALITGERGTGQLTRHGLEEYVSDCVVLLDQRVENQIATRRIRVVKYRGTTHGTDEYPFLIDENGISVLPVTSLKLEHPASTQRMSSGIDRLDAMLGGKGYYKGSTILVSGTAGTGKTTLVCTAVDAACRRGERCLYLAFEESPDQIMRNMRSVGLDLKQWEKKGLLQFNASRPTAFGLEMHLLSTHKAVDAFKPSLVVIDPISNLFAVGITSDVTIMLTRLIDFLKSRGVTTILTSLTHGTTNIETTDVSVSSLVDTWLLLKDIEIGGERNRGLYILKSRGMGHSNQIREYKLTERGIELLDVYAGPEGVLTGTARLAQEAKEKAASAGRQQEVERKRRELERKRLAMKAQIDVLQADYQGVEEEMKVVAGQDTAREKTLAKDRQAMAKSRKAD
jgi:circadian clock protein KaiC